MDIISSIVVFAAIIFAVYGRHKLSVGDVALAINYSLRYNENMIILGRRSRVRTHREHIFKNLFRLTEILGWFVRRVSFTEANIVAVERIEKYLNEVEQEAPHEMFLDDSLVDWPATGEIKFVFIRPLLAKHANGAELCFSCYSFWF